MGRIVQAGGKDLFKGLRSMWGEEKEQKYKSVLFIIRLFVWVEFLFRGRRRKKALLCLLLLFENSHKSCPESNLGLRRSGQ